MVQMIGRRIALKKYPSLPTGNWRTGKFNFPTTHSGCILAGVGSSERSRHKAAISGMILLLKSMGIETLIFMIDTSKPWLFRDGKAHKSAAMTMDFLKSLGAGQKFTGGFVVPISESPSFLNHAFRLSGTNSISGNIHLIDEREQVLCNPCKYGNFHFYNITSAASRKFTNSLVQTELVMIPQC